MNIIQAMSAIDSYKLGHMTQYPENTEVVGCNFTGRSFRHLREYVPEKYFNNKAVVIGFSGALQEIVECFKETFFDLDLPYILQEFDETISPFVGENDKKIILDNFTKLHNLGYLPLEFKALPEGSQVGENVPMVTWKNTHKDFGWLPNYLETFLSSESWKTPTCATIAKVYKRIFDDFAEKTGTPSEITAIQGHDFSTRGMSGIHDGASTGIGHLASFIGTDSISSTLYVRKYYEGSSCPLIGCSVPATEHSVMCLGGELTEEETFLRLFRIYPTGIVSIVSDTWDFWDTITVKARKLKPEIMSRGKDSLGLCKTVFRPDTGVPEDVICGTALVVSELAGVVTRNAMEEKGATVVKVGDTYYRICPDTLAFEKTEATPEEKGAVECLDEIFGHTLTEKGYKMLDEHVGLIYGDSITPMRALEIMERLEKKGYASGNVVLGIGSYTYQFMTRDTLGFAIKATYGIIDGDLVMIHKSPKTDPGKKSAKGMLEVQKDANGDYCLIDGLSATDGGCLETIFKDGSFQNLPTFNEIRERMSND